MKTATNRAAARQQNLDAAQREMDRRAAEGEDMTGATIDPVTYAITRHPDVVAAEALYAAEMAAEFQATELNPNSESDNTMNASPATLAAEAAADDREIAAWNAGTATPEAPEGEDLTEQPFSFTPVNLTEVGRTGHGRVEVKVDGYWSSSSITMYIERKFNWSDSTADNDAGNWEATISHSSGGRDDAEEPDGLTASANFGRALIALAAYGRSLMTPENIAAFEAHFQARRAEAAAAREVERAAQEARIAADRELGLAAAKALVNLAVATVKAAPLTQWRFNECVVTISTPQRGSDPADECQISLTVSATRAGIVKVYNGGSALSNAKAIEFLAERSHRAAIKSVTNPATDVAQA